MKRHPHQAAPRGLSLKSSTTDSQHHRPDIARVRYAVGRLIVDQDGERTIGFRTQFAFVWANADIAKRFADSANDPKFRFIRT
jgi:hypothetical protein